MAACDEWVFENINESKFEQLKHKLSGLGLVIESNSGSISGPMGVKMDYSWSSELSILKCKIIDRPFFLNCANLKAQIEKAINNSSIA